MAITGKGTKAPLEALRSEALRLQPNDTNDDIGTLLAPPRRGRIQTVPISDVTIRLDMTRIYRNAYERAGQAHGLADIAAAEREAEDEFSDEFEEAI